MHTRRISMHINGDFDIIFVLLWKKRGITEPSEKVLWISKSIQMCPKSQKRIKNSTEPFESSEEYPQAESSLTKPFFRFCTAKKGSVEKCETLRVQYKSIRVSYPRVMVLYWTLNVSYWTLKVSHFSTEPFFAVQNLKKCFVRDGSACGYSSELSKGSVEFFIFFLRLWTHLDAFRNLQNLSGGGSVNLLFFLRAVFNEYIFKRRFNKRKWSQQSDLVFFMKKDVLKAHTTIFVISTLDSPKISSL